MTLTEELISTWNQRKDFKQCRKRTDDAYDELVRIHRQRVGALTISRVGNRFEVCKVSDLAELLSEVPEVVAESIREGKVIDGSTWIIAPATTRIFDSLGNDWENGYLASLATGLTQRSINGAARRGGVTADGRGWSRVSVDQAVSNAIKPPKKHGRRIAAPPLVQKGAA